MTRNYPRPESLDVLFVTYGGGHIQMVLPVALQLHEHGLRVCVFALTTAISVVESSGLPFFTYADLPQFEDPETRALGERLAATLPSFGVLPPRETQAYLSLNYRDLERDHGAAVAADLWALGGRQNFHPFHIMYEVLAHLKPSVVVATNSPRSEKAAIEAASALGIPAAAMVDMFALHEMKWLARPAFGRHLFVLDESVRQRMIQLGRPSTEVTVTGNPAFDTLHDPKLIAAGRKLRAERRWGSSSRFVILSASTPEPDRHPFTGEPANPTLPRIVEEELRRIVLSDPRLELVIRRHPSEDQSVIPGERTFVSTRSDDVNMVIHAVDLVVVTCSTVGLQAYLAGVPVVSVEGSVFTKDAPYAEYGMATPVPSASFLGPAIASLLGRSRPRNDVCEAPLRESATKRIAQAIMDGLNRGWSTGAT